MKRLNTFKLDNKSRDGNEIQGSAKNLWRDVFDSNWTKLEYTLQLTQVELFCSLYNEIISHIKENYFKKESYLQNGIPAVSVLQAPNEVSRDTSWNIFINMIVENVTPHVAIIEESGAPSQIEIEQNLVWQLMKDRKVQVQAELNTSIATDSPFINTANIIKSFNILRIWYKAKYSKTRGEVIQPLIVVIKDFNSIPMNIMQYFIMSIGRVIESVPIVLVFGNLEIIKGLLTCNALSQLTLKEFVAPSSSKYVKKIFEKILLETGTPFHMSGMAVEVIHHLHYFYGLNTANVVALIKYCMLNHYQGDNLKSLCCDPNGLKDAIDKLCSDDLRNARHLSSFRSHLNLQTRKRRSDLLANDNLFKEELYMKMIDLHDYAFSFCTLVKLLRTFILDKHDNYFGDSVHGIYIKCSVKCVHKSIQFQYVKNFIYSKTKMELVVAIKRGLQVIYSSLALESLPEPNLFQEGPSGSSFAGNLGTPFIEAVGDFLAMSLKRIEAASINFECMPGPSHEQRPVFRSEFEIVRFSFVNTLHKIFTKGLNPINTNTFYEILFFNDIEHIRQKITSYAEATTYPQRSRVPMSLDK